MPEVAFSRRAELDLELIDDYTADTWGDAQADLYLNQLNSFLALLARNPRIGRVWESSPRNLRRIEHGSHVIFYSQTEQGILIARILHQNMLPIHHAMDDSE